MSLITVSLTISISILSICLILTLVRFIKGPSLPDRVVALDVFAGNVLAILAIYSVLTEVEVFLNVALALSLIAFVGTMSFAYYLVRQKED
jgi:multicomponent Na+:H+ antiporter subunit F